MLQSVANSVALALKCVRSCVSEIFILSVILSVVSIEYCIMYYLSITLVPALVRHSGCYFVWPVLKKWSKSSTMAECMCVWSRRGRELVVCCYSSCKKDGCVFDWLQWLPDWFPWTTFTNIQMSHGFKKCLAWDFWHFCWRVKNAILFFSHFLANKFVKQFLHCLFSGIIPESPGIKPRWQR